MTTQELEACAHEKSFRWGSDCRPNAVAPIGRSQRLQRSFGSKASPLYHSSADAALRRESDITLNAIHERRVHGWVAEGGKHKRYRTGPGPTGDDEGQDTALFNVDGNFFALSNACTHEEGPLAEGEILGHEAICPLHGAEFDIRTGEVLGPPVISR